MATKTTFTLAANIAGDATSGILVGEFNNWDESKGIELKKQKDGSFTAEVALEAGKTYHYRYLLNDGRWENDGNADHYSHVHGLHVDNCVITVPAEKEPAHKKETVAEKEAEPVKAAAPKKVAAAKKEAAPKKEAPLKKEAAPKTAAPKKAKAVTTEKVEAKAEKAPAKKVAAAKTKK